MIVFKDWNITVTGTIARQYDNLSRRIDVTGDLPEGFTWRLLVQCGSNADTILLTPTDTGVGAVLTADNLSVAGEYEIQLKGTAADGVTTRHTNIAVTCIHRSMTGVGAWPQVPTEFAQIEANITELYQHPPVPGSNGYWLVWDSDADEYVESQLPLPEATTGGTSDHAKLKNRDAADQHPMSAITGLDGALAGKQPTGDYLTEEMDPTVPDWAKQPQKPTYTAQEVGALPATTHIPSTAADVNAEPSGAVSQHNVSDVAHNDIRILIQGLSERLSSVADSDDTTLDQLSEIVAYIKSNKSLIDAITTSKVNVADIVDNLTTNVANKPLSAAQGVALKALIDAITVPTALSELTDDTTHRVVTDAEKAVWNAKSNFTGSYNDLTEKPTIPAPYTLPIASATQLGGVKPVTKTDAMTQSVGVDEAGALWAPAASGGGSGNQWTHIIDFTLAEDVSELFITQDAAGNTFEYDELFVQIVFASSPNNTEEKSVELKWLFDKSTSKKSGPFELPYGQRKNGTVTHSILCAGTNFPDGKNTFVCVSFQNSKLDNFTNNYNRLSGIRLWPYTQYIAAGTVIRMFGRNHK